MRTGTKSALSAAAALVVTLSCTAPPAAASAAEKPLKLELPQSWGTGEAVAITAVGTADGTLRLFLYADEQRRPCAATPQAEQHGSWELTPFGGEALPAGRFSRTYTFTAQYQLPELCAYLDDGAAATPAATAHTPNPVQEYQEQAGEAAPISSWSGELPGAIKPLPVNVQEMNEYWTRVEREEREGHAARTAPAPCVVPRLRGHTLAGARRALAGAGCSLGHVRRRRGAGGRLVVLSQGTAAGIVRQAGAPVAVTLGERRR